MTPATVGRRYLVLRSLAPHRYEVRDLGMPVRPLVLAEYPGLPADSLAEERQELSWLSHPDILLPQDLFASGDTVCAVSRAAEGKPLADHLARETPTVFQVLLWLRQACDLVHFLHTAGTRPLVLGRLGLESFAVGRRLQLVGFGLDSRGRVAFTASAWSAPEGPRDPRADVYCLGMLLRALLARLDVTQTLTVHRDLWRLLARSTSEDPARRYPSVRGMRAAVDRLIRRRARGPEWPWLPPFARGRRWDPRPLLRVATALVAAGLLLWGAGEIARAWADTGLGLPWGLRSGREVWLEGTAAPLTPRTERAPLSNVPCLAWQVDLGREMSRLVLTERGYRLAVYRRQDEPARRSVPWAVAGATVGADLRMVGSAAAREWRAEQGPAPAWMARLPGAWKVDPGERIGAVRVREVALRAGDPVCVRGRVGPDLALHGPVSVLRGTRMDWLGWVLARFLAGGVAELAALALAMACWWMGGKR